MSSKLVDQPPKLIRMRIKLVKNVFYLTHKVGFILMGLLVSYEQSYLKFRRSFFKFYKLKEIYVSKSADLGPPFKNPI